MSEIEIHAFPDGPYVIAGETSTLDADGSRVVRPGTAVALCRCGRSGDLPYCDGAHTAIGFRAPELKLSVRSEAPDR